MATTLATIKESTVSVFAAAKAWLPSSGPEGYTAIPSFPSYGATSTGPPTGALQSLPPDASKIEPKVWLASERTFLNWLRVSLLVSSFALTLFNTAGDGDWVAKGMGLIYVALAFGMMGYAWVMHEKRRKRIVERYAGHHDAVAGPMVICAAIFLAVLLNFILRVNQRERLRDLPTPKNPWVLVGDTIISAFTFSR